jgi:hypothetical protein
MIKWFWKRESVKITKINKRNNAWLATVVKNKTSSLHRSGDCQEPKNPPK